MKSSKSTGFSLEDIKERIFAFLKSDAPEAMVIKGAWGAGKTFTWKKYLKEAKEAKGIALDRYVYVSLFGITSLDDLKRTLFQNSIDKKSIGNEPGVGFLEKVIHFLMHHTLSVLFFIPFLVFVLSLFPGVTFKDSLEIVSTIIGLLLGLSALYTLPHLYKLYIKGRLQRLQKTLICLDDFERMQLNAQDVLGLMSELKEQKHCKFVLIMNEKALTEDLKKEYETYREKVLDKQVSFAPTPEDCFSLVFGEGSDQNPDSHENSEALFLKEKCSILEINNIRILQRIKKLWDQELKPHCKDYESETRSRAMSSLVLFTSAFYTKDGTVPGEDLDCEIDSLVKNGFPNTEELNLALKSLNDENLIQKKQQRLKEALALFKNSFDDNEKEVVDAIYTAAEDYINNIDSNDLDIQDESNLNTAVKWLRGLGHEEKADGLIALLEDRFT